MANYEFIVTFQKFKMADVFSGNTQRFFKFLITDLSLVVKNINILHTNQSMSMCRIYSWKLIQTKGGSVVRSPPSGESWAPETRLDGKDTYLLIYSCVKHLKFCYWLHSWILYPKFLKTYLKIRNYWHQKPLYIKSGENRLIYKKHVRHLGSALLNFWKVAFNS